MLGQGSVAPTLAISKRRPSHTIALGVLSPHFRSVSTAMGTTLASNLLHPPTCRTSLPLGIAPPPSPTLDTALRSQRGGHPGRYRPRCGLTAQQAAYGHAYSADPMRLPFV